MILNLFHKHKTNPAFIILSIFIIAVAIGFAMRVSAQVAEQKALTAAEEADRAYQARFSYEEYVVQDGDVVAAILQNEVGLDYDTTLKIVDAINSVHDVTKIKIDQTLTWEYFDGVFRGLFYDSSGEEQVFITLNDDGTVLGEKRAIEYDVEMTSRRGTIETSFYNDGINAGLTPRIIMELAGIFAFDVDFVNSIQKGDSFAVVYERLGRDGELVGTRDILAARFTTNGETFYAYQVTDADGNKEHYGPDGGSSRRLLLKSPLNFKRISSNFGIREHPVLGGLRQHNGIDLAAPTGTPVESVGDGTVVRAGWNGGYGKYIEIKHSAGYTTAYAHLSKINVSKGDRVRQGELIGEVGSTGRSTGPHLHYELHFNGSIVHPFNTDTPKEEPITDELRPELERMVAEYEGQIQ
jgi:murein DD-endopeptidase MepM/ murein hydrolase activator NlpD